MGFFSSLRMALHNIWANKSRSILTIVIVFVVSTLIMALLLIGTNFLENMNRANTLSFETRGTSYRLEAPNRKDYMKRATYKEVLKTMEIAKKYPFAVSSAYQRLNDDNGFVIDGRGDNRSDIKSAVLFNFNLPLSLDEGTFIEGAQWTGEDEGGNGLWLSEQFVIDQLKNGTLYKVGQTVKYPVQLHRRENDGNDMFLLGEANEYVIKGIIRVNKEGGISQLNNLLGFVSGMYALNAEQLKSSTDYTEMTMSFNPAGGAFNFTVVEKEMTEFTKEVNSTLGKGSDYYGKPTDRFTCSFLEIAKISKIMGLVIMAVLVLLAFLILALSIGSVANTIIISVDKNKKFIGLMMAMGLNNRGVKKIVHKEAIIQILIGVLLAVLVIFLAQGLMLSLLQQMLGALFMSLLGGASFTIEFTLAFYVPICTIIMFVLMALLFSKGALNKMGKTDVIAVISEVA